MEALFDRRSRNGAELPESPQLANLLGCRGLFRADLRPHSLWPTGNGPDPHFQQSAPLQSSAFGGSQRCRRWQNGKGLRSARDSRYARQGGMGRAVAAAARIRAGGVWKSAAVRPRHSVAHTAQVEEPGRIRRVLADLCPGAPDEVAQQPEVALPAPVPGLAHQGLMGHCPARASGRCATG